VFELKGSNVLEDQNLENHIANFVFLLRKQGVRVGTAELMEALEGVSVAGLKDREAFKTALRATLIKKAPDFEVFEHTFEKYFLPSNEQKKELQRGWECEEKYIECLEKADNELTFKGEKLDLAESEKVVFASLPEKEQNKIKQFVSETELGKNVEPEFKPILETTVKSSLRYWRNRQENTIQRPPSITGDSGWDWMLAGSSAGGAGGGSSGNGIRELDMKNITDKDVPEAAELIRKMTRRLIYSLSRRYRISKKKRELDLRRTIRDNISYGGYIYHLRYRDKKKQKLRLLLLCDISGSMIRYTGFILPFIYGLNSVVSDLESFVFAENLEKISGSLERGASFEEARKELLKKSREWGGGTRLAIALETLMQEHDELLTPKTIVIIVSDTRTTLLDEALRRMENVHDRVKDIVWLNTLPPEEWEELRSVSSFQKLTRMYPCNRLADLEHVLEKKIF